MTGYRRARPLATLGAVSLVALLAFAGPAAATDSSRGEDDPAGTIAAFDGESGKLTIDLARGGAVSGFVTSRTWIDDGDGSCDRGNRRQSRRAFHGDFCERRLSGDRGHGGRDWPHGPDGDESDLVAGTVVEDAILVLKDGRALFAKVELED